MAKVTDCPRETCFIIAGNEYYAMKPVHLFWHLTDKKKKSYALDLTSHQFGHHEALTPLKTYRAKLTFDVWGTFPAGHERDRQLGLDTLVEQLAARMLVQQGVITANTIRSWESSKMSMRQLLRLPEAEFELKKAELIQLCDACVSRAIEQQHQLGLEIRHGAA